jgi:serine/threonine protein kinase
VSAEEETRNVQESTKSLPVRPRLEDYVRRYPELGPLEQVSPAIIGEEYRARQRWGDRPAHDDYLARFRRQAPLLEQLLSAIDRELAEDPTASAAIGPPETRPVGPEMSAAEIGGRRSPPKRIGKYHVVGVLEEGGQAEVYRAVHPALSKELVVKLGRNPTGAGLREADQLVAEGRLLAELEHPNLARVYDLDFHQRRPFLVMEYVRGRNLRQHAREHRYAPGEAALLVAKTARALAAAHVRGIIHQDVKPGNIIIDEAGEPRVIDFGLARLRPAWGEEPDEPGTISGTVQYMSPEQARGEFQNIDPRSDVFALGAVLYFLLVGKAPFVDKTVLASLDRARQCDFDASALRKARVPRRLEAVCLRAMQADPADRYASAEEMAADLDRFVAGPRRLKIALAALAGVILASLLALGTRAVLSSRPDTQPSPPQTVEPIDAAMDILGRPLRNDFLLEFEILGQSGGSGNKVVLTEGQRVAFRVEAERDCYLGVWHVDQQNVVTQLFPNQHDSDHFIPARRARTIPGEMEYAITVTASEGEEYLHVVASTQQWEAPLGSQHGPYVVFATPEELERWRDVRGMILDKDRSPAVAEQLLLLDVRPE